MCAYNTKKARSTEKKMSHRRHKSDEFSAHTIKSCNIYSKNLTAGHVVVAGTLSASRLDAIEFAAQRQLRFMSDELDKLRVRVNDLERSLRFQNTSDNQVVITGAPLVIRPV